MTALRCWTDLTGRICWWGWPFAAPAHIWASRHSPTFWAPAVDPGWYDQAAQRMVAGDWGPFPLFRAPLYPALLAAIYGLFGHDLLAARLLNVVLQGATVWALWRIGARTFRRGSASWPPGCSR